MTLAALERLQALYAAGSLTEVEYAAAKAAVLAPLEGQTNSALTPTQRADHERLLSRVAVLECEAELERLDREWDADVVGQTPAGCNLLLGAMLSILGAGSLFQQRPFGVLFLLAGLASGALGCLKINHYQQERGVYDGRREEIVAKLDRAHAVLRSDAETDRQRRSA